MTLKKSISVILILLGGLNYLKAQSTYPYQQDFQSAYNNNQLLPQGILEAVAFVQTRIVHLDGHEEPSCTGIPKTYGVMGLVADGQGYFNNTLTEVSSLSGYSSQQIINNPADNIGAYAKALNQTLLNNGAVVNDYSAIAIALGQLSEIPFDSNAVNDYARSAFVYQVLDFMRDEENQAKFGFTAPVIDLEAIFGKENLKILSSKKVLISSTEVKDAKGNHYQSSGQTKSQDYAPALWVATPTCNYSSRNGTAISAVTIHTIQGTYAGAISWAQNCNANVSYHYVVRSSDGQITQMVYETDKGWHVGSENPYTIGIEHEGYVDNPAWYTPSLYNASANLVKDITQSGYGINPLRTFQGPATVGLNTLGGCTKIKGHQHYPNQSHTDPGINWDWEHFYQLINDNPPVTTLNTTSGVFYDSGGSTGNYSDDERELYLIQPGNVLSVTINFVQFSLENNWDYMYVYDGTSLSDPLLGVYTGTAVPSSLTSSGDAILIEFRSDCATQDAGWEISWTSVPGPTPGDVVAPTTSISTVGNWKTTDFTATFSDADNVGGSGVHQRFYQVIDFDGTEWRANANNGFFSDNFDATIHADWTQQVGTWGINSMKLRQSDEANTNTNIWAGCNQDNDDQWLYHFGLNISGAGGNRRGGFHFMCDDATLTNRGNSYFIWLRVDDDKIQIYKTINDTFYLQEDITYTVNENQWYDIKTVFDKATGLISLYIDDALEASWVDVAPYTTGNSVSFRSGDAIMDIENFKVYHNRGVSEMVTINTGNDIQYENLDPLTHAAKVKSIVIDSAANISGIAQTLVNVDWTPPTTIATINDGTAADINTFTDNSQISANWTPSVDPNSDLAEYFYSIGTSPLAADIVPWTGNWFADTLTKTGLSLVEGDTYYVCVYAKNGADLFSDTTCSDGQTLQAPTSGPTAGFVVPNAYICSYEAVQVFNSSTNAQTYSWSAPGATPSTSTDANPVFTYSATGYYDITLTATSTGGTDTDIQTIFVNIDTVPEAAYAASEYIVDISNPFVSFTNQSLHANGYTWNFGDGNFSNDVNPWHEYAAIGDYYVELIAVNGLCPNDTTVALVQVVDNLSVGEDMIGGFAIYPNPVAEELNIQLNNSWEDVVKVELIDPNGKIVLIQTYKKGSNEPILIDQKRVSSGAYFIRISDSEKVVSQKILVKTH
ncbi:N-acetylmuramoyl-L-alanine amidase [Paracrocinitomix mangrovi]|uniref:N-acetylmuramoyl-L-alanine amidase n=1 Tax=Paracrocinitomix mangrovi TaxID=2862509 RepID=UPI001C8D6660|nr:N-acetylmuramoyl-L-alanine amidase [Paracrocinitomix mangrovi]UKN01629.1 N-acetylmuramoyl-L-alanine amidase [Paracrocinitomix mangrovi]